MKSLYSLLLSFFIAAAAFGQGKPEGLFLNARAPEIRGKDQSGVDVSLKELRKKGPVVVMFYRGHWCPYCSRHLARFQDSLSLITEKGATLVAVTPETADGIAKTLEKTKLVYPIISDPEMKFAKAYQVHYEVDERTVGRYKNAGVDLLTINGQKGKAALPVPAVYIVNKEGSIIYRFFDEDYKKRPSVKAILNEIK